MEPNAGKIYFINIPNTRLSLGDETSWAAEMREKDEEDEEELRALMEYTWRTFRDDRYYMDVDEGVIERRRRAKWARTAFINTERLNRYTGELYHPLLNWGLPEADNDSDASDVEDEPG